MLTKKQRQLVALIDRRSNFHQPTVQRDLAEAMGIRRDSLNKLLHRARQRMAADGVTLKLPSRQGAGRASVMSLSDAAVA